MADALTESAPLPDADQAKINAWTYANKVCSHTLINTLSNDLFDVYHVYKETSKIWESLIISTLLRMLENRSLLLVISISGR